MNMEEIIIKIIDENSKQDINIPNEEFKIIGRMIPQYVNEKWSYSTELLPKEEVTTMIFPDENYNFDNMKKEHIFVGAYYEDECVGLAILKHNWNKYLYLYDLKVNKKFRNYKIGKKLIEKSKTIADNLGYRGIYTQGQDNNLLACLFYVNNGFKIGGFDNKIYIGTKQEGKADIIFYLDLNN